MFKEDVTCYPESLCDVVKEAGNSIQILEQNIEWTGFVMLRGSTLRPKKRCFAMKKSHLSAHKLIGQLGMFP